MAKLTHLIPWIILISLYSCEENYTDPEIRDGFILVINDTLIYNSNSINFYDFSSHLIYLKEGNFSFSGFGSFSVSVDKEEIYSGQMFPLYSSYLPAGPVIPCAPSFYDDFIIPIEFFQVTDPEGITNEDPRNDTRIIEALKKYDQYRQGMTMDILSIEKTDLDKLTMTVGITNHDSETVLIPDPEKMGMELFHYYTNGLTLVDSLNNSYTHKITPEGPNPYDSWEKDWLTEVKENEIRTFTIVYNDFESFPPGNYTARFVYPGMSYQIERKNLEQRNGRIWLGEIKISKEIAIE